MAVDSVVLPKAHLAARAEPGESDFFYAVQQVLLGRSLGAGHVEAYPSLKSRV